MRAIALGLVIGGHGLVGAAFMVAAPTGQVASGGAPVINLTLTPRAQFDGSDASLESLPATASGAAAKLRPTDIVRPRALMPVPAGQAPAMAPTSEMTEPATTTAGRGPPSLSQRALEGVGQGRGDRSGSSEPSSNGTTEGGGARTLGGAVMSEEDDYAAAVIAWVERHKGRPREQLRGDVVLRFVLDRRGRLRALNIIGSSESHALDRLAHDAIQAAQPFPLPPSGSTWHTREFRLRLQYKPRE